MTPVQEPLEGELQLFQRFLEAGFSLLASATTMAGMNA